MNFFDRGRKKHRVPANATFCLTQDGREKLQEFGGDPKSSILVALETRGTSNMGEISKASGLTVAQVEGLVPALVEGGYIKYVGRSAEDDDFS